MASKKRRSGNGNKGNKGPRQGISGNPQRRAAQLAARRPAAAGEPEPMALDFRPKQPEGSMETHDSAPELDDAPFRRRE